MAAGATLKRAGANSAFVSQGRQVEVQGTLDLSVAQTIFNSGTVGLIHVAAGGTIQRTSTSGTATVNPPVDNDGTVNTAVANGAIVLNGGTTGTSTGDYGSAAAPGTIDFASGTHFLGNGSRILGGVNFSGAIMQVVVGATTTVSGANGMSVGTIGGSGTFDLTSGTFTWTGGSFDDNGTTRVAPGAILRRAGANSAFVSDGRQVEVQGTLDLSVVGQIFNSGVVGLIHVAAGGTLQRTTSAGLAVVNPPVDNDGTVRALFAASELELNGGSTGTSTGTYGGAADAGSVELTGGTHFLGNATFAGGVTVTGATVQVTAGQTTNVTGANALGGGTVGGTGTFNLTSGVFSWGGGSFDGAGTTRVAPGATLRRTGANSVFVANSRQVEVEGTLDLSVAQTIFSSGTPGQIHVAPGGTMQRTTTTGVAAVNPPVDNDGTVEALTGTLDINGTLANYNASSDTLTGGTFAARGAELELPGVVQVNSSTLVLEDSTALMSTGGQNALAGLDLQGGLGTLEMESNASLTLDGSLTNAGTVRLSDSAELETTGNYTQTGGVTQLVSSATLLTAAGATVNIFGGRLEGAGTVTPALLNEAEVRPGSSPGVLTVSGSYTQTSDGTLRIEVGGVHPGDPIRPAGGNRPRDARGDARGRHHQRIRADGGPELPGRDVQPLQRLVRGRDEQRPALGVLLFRIAERLGDRFDRGGRPASGHDAARHRDHRRSLGLDGRQHADLRVQRHRAGLDLRVQRRRRAFHFVLLAVHDARPARRLAHLLGSRARRRGQRRPCEHVQLHRGGDEDRGPAGADARRGGQRRAGAGQRAGADRGPGGFVRGAGPREPEGPQVRPADRGAPDPDGLLPRHQPRHGADAERDRPGPEGSVGQVQRGRLPGASVARAPRPRPHRAAAEGRQLQALRRPRQQQRSATAAQLSRRTVRRLRANARGRFQTRGNNSSATVRGTIWTTTDRCDGTLTQVRRGTVVVRDFRRKRNVIVRAGKSYLARARG